MGQLIEQKKEFLLVHHEQYNLDKLPQIFRTSKIMKQKANWQSSGIKSTLFLSCNKEVDFGPGILREQQCDKVMEGIMNKFYYMCFAKFNVYWIGY